MGIKIAAWSLLLLAFLVVAVAGQKTASVKTRFTSVYTSLYRGCKTLHGPEGTDDAFICKGARGYQVYQYSAAAASYIVVELRGTDEKFMTATVNFDFDASKATMEWRLANGKPFATILRLPKYADPTGDNEYFGKVIGYELVIAGLKGFDIDAKVDTKTANANAKAREIADEAYSGHH